MSRVGNNHNSGNSRGELLQEIMGDNSNESFQPSNELDDKDFQPSNERERQFLENNKIKNNTYSNKARQSYMAQPNVKEFNRGVREHMLHTGRPYAFESIESLSKELNDYYDLCETTATVPTITGIALWLGVNRDTIYAHANNINSPFSDLCKTIITYCHLNIENGTIDGKINPVTYIFMGKNYFGLRDDKDINIKPVDSSPSNTQTTMEAIQKQLEEENIPNATYKITND